MPGWMSTREVAEELGVHEETVRKWLRAGKLKGSKPGGKKGNWKIRKERLREI